jgi:hypothetical protein
MFSLLLDVYGKVSFFLTWLFESGFRIFILLLLLGVVSRIVYRTIEIKKLLLEIPDAVRYRRRGRWYTAREIAIMVGQNRAFHIGRILKASEAQALKYVSLTHVSSALATLTRRNVFEEMSSGYHDREKTKYCFRE